MNPHDSVNLKNQIESFYSWYLNMIKEERVNPEFNPLFVRRADGMTTLDFTKYKAQLIKYKFTEDFIQRKISGYNQCLENLHKMPFDKFSQLNDLDEFENINCDFSNRYEWIGGMEPKDKAELTSLKLINKKTIAGYVNFISNLKPDGSAMVLFKKFGREWKIDNLELEYKNKGR